MAEFFPRGWYLLIACCGFLIYHLRVERNVISLPVIFNGCCLLYFFCGIFLRGLAQFGYTGLLLDLSIIAVFSFNFGYIIFRNTTAASLPLNLKFEDSVSNSTLGLILLIALSAEAYVIFSVGVNDFFFIDRYARFPLLKAYQPYLFVANATYIVLALAMIKYIAFKNREAKLIFYLCLGHNFIFAFLTISRSSFLLIFIILIYVLENFGLIRKQTILALGGGLIILLFFVRGFLYLYLLNDDSMMYFNPGEIVNWVKNSEILLDNEITSRDLPANSYWLAMKSLVIPSPGADAPAEWFIKTFYADRAVPGFTRGFSGLMEGYLYFKELGVFFHFIIIGILFSVLQNARSLFSVALTVFFCYATFRLFRSEAYNFVKYVHWYYTLPLLAIFTFDHILKRAYR